VPFIDPTRLSDLVLAVFAVEHPAVFGAYSEFDRDLESFTTPQSLEEYVAARRQMGQTSFDFAIWYPGCNGRVERDKISLKPEYCDGHTTRFVVGGWGILHLQLDFKPAPRIDCRIAVNSEKRAIAWQTTCPEWLGVDAWDWAGVRKQERRLVRKLRSLT
jgi:hypothetical protein